MMDLMVFNSDIQLIGIVDAFTSLIWANRYFETGDCELYIPATAENLVMLRKGYYLKRTDDEMICNIKKIELDTNAETGNYLVITGIDCKALLDQRIVWAMQTADGNAEAFLRQLVDSALGNADAERKLIDSHGNRLFFLAAAKGFSEALTEQVSYKNIGEKCREYCRRFGWGYQVTEADGKLYFGVFRGTDRSESVVFSNDYENLAESKYIEDETSMGNVALIGGEGEGAKRTKSTAGTATGVNRYELFVDAKDLSSTIEYKDLHAAYPNGTISGISGIYFYDLSPLDILILDPAQLARLQQKYPSGQIVTIDGIQYFEIPSTWAAVMQTDTPVDDTEVTLNPIIYEQYLISRGNDAMSEYGAVKSFEGTILPNVTFLYKQDYFLGDIVTVENSYGISVQARITEVIEVWDENGYSVEPKFEYITKE